MDRPDVQLAPPAILRELANALRSSNARCQTAQPLRVERRNLKVRPILSVFLELAAQKLLAAAGPFGLDELEDARYESMCAARHYLKGKFDAKGAIAHVKESVRNGRCTHAPETEHHV